MTLQVLNDRSVTIRQALEQQVGEWQTFKLPLSPSLYPRLLEFIDSLRVRADTTRLYTSLCLYKNKHPNTGIYLFAFHRSDRAAMEFKLTFADAQHVEAGVMPTTYHFDMVFDPHDVTMFRSHPTHTYPDLED